MLTLSSPQRLIYDMEKYAGGSIAVICGSVLLKGQRDPEELLQAANAILCRNEALRTYIVEQDGQVLQEVRNFHEQINVLHFDSKDSLTAHAEEYAKVPVPLSGSLCEIQVVLLPEHYGLLVKCHHIIGDAWTLTLIASQFCALLNGGNPSVYPYADYIENEAAYMRSDRWEKDKSFFMERFKTCPEVTYLCEKSRNCYDARRAVFQIDADLTARLRSYAKEHHTSPFVLLLTAFAIYLSRVKGNAETFYIGTPILNRKGFQEKNTMGMFINTVPVLSHVEYGRSFADNLAAMQGEIFSALRHQRFHYNEILSTIRQEYGFTDKLYDVILSYQNATVTGADGEVETTWYHNGTQTESLQVHIDDRDSRGAFCIHLDYRTDKFTTQEIQRMYGHILNLLTDSIANDQKKPGELELLSAGERKQILFDFNDTAADYPREKCVHTLFEEQVERTPDKTAVIACDRTLTYQELNEEANRIAHGLIEQGVKFGDIVAFALPRDSHLIPTMFGILKTGAVYLPIDSDYPQDRINFMLQDSQTKLFITEKNILALLENEDVDNLNMAQSSESLCYCIYTSGTTGNPKGALVRHRNVINFVQNNDANAFQKSILNCCDYVIAINSISFDITLQEIHLPLVNGHGIVLFSDEQTYDMEKYAHLFSGKHCGLIITPTKLKLYMTNQIFCDSLKNVATIMCGAEPFPRELQQEIRKYTDAVVFNGYGPTETTCGVLYSNIANTSGVTIGKPITNTQIYIVDRLMNPVPIGVTGELCIAGDGVGAGYLNRPKLTAEKFIDNPFGDGKLYKTGDLAYWREDGNIVYVGRNDFQVKIRGLRIELGEIENAIAAMEGISQAVVVVRKDDTGRQLICAFYVETTPVELEHIKSALRKVLPRYMVPHIFTRLEAIPLTTSGKVNRNALPEVDLSSLAAATEYVSPVGEMEKRLAVLMGQVLSYSPVGREDDFFDLGGDSLKAIEFVSKAHNDGIYFSLQSIFDHPTVKSLCEYIEHGDRPNISYSEEDFAAINTLLAKNCIETATAPLLEEVGNLLLAGATGFLGIHILSEFLEHDNGIAYCLVRGENIAASEKRLASLLNFYFDGKYVNLLGGRIQVICGDLQKEDLGLTQEEYQELQKRVDTVINAAASVKHYGSYQYFYEVNVESTRRLIDFCLSADAKLIHVSTLSVSGNGFDTFDDYVSGTEKYFHESDLYIGQPLNNVYARSKFEAEKVVLEAITRGLKASIMRMGNLTNRQSDGRFQINHQTNAAARLIKGIIELGLVPSYLIEDNMYVEFTPVDEAARAIMLLTRQFDPVHMVFHINSTKVVYWDKLIDFFSALGYPIKAVPGTEFAAAIQETAEQSGREYIFETFINYMDKQNQLTYDSYIRIENAYTEKHLRRLGFDWGEIGLEYLRKYVGYFERIGWFSKK